MNNPKTFEITAKPDDGGDGYTIKAGHGCVWLSVIWAAAAILGAIGALAKAFH